MNSDESDPLIDGGSVGFPNATVLAVEPTVDGDVGEHRNELLPPKLRMVPKWMQHSGMVGTLKLTGILVVEILLW